ncbi:MAG: hypothetical protein L0271_11485 [Gemmatimonadetes bacterium]|nr:hypothetical protein [Gemmatimonadota bacterium]
MNRLLILALLAAVPSRSAAQCLSGSVADQGSAPCTFRAARWSGEVASLGANALLGALSAGLHQRFRGGSFAEGFTRGALGGALMYAGKRISLERFAGAGLAGREINAIGASAARNAGLGVPVFSRLTLPFGPLWLELERTSAAGTRLGARVDPIAVGWFVYGIVEDELRLDAGDSFSAGTPVFRTDGKLLKLDDDSAHAGGLTSAGVVFLADVPAFEPEYGPRSLRHERVHVLQEDAIAILWTDPVAGWALRRSGALTALAPRIAVNLSTELFGLLGPLFARHEDRPWELEAIFLAR